jgi:hypothetical protein
MLKQAVVCTCLALCLLTQVAIAESATYHLKRLEIQTKAFLATLDGQTSVPPANPVSLDDMSESTSVEEQLRVTVEAPTWAENMVRDDLLSLLSTSQALQQQLQNADTEEYLRAKIELESLARRLRISTSPLELNPQQTASLEFVMLELEEASAVLAHERQQRIAKNESDRRRERVSIGMGFGYGGWGPWGYNNWGYGGFYSPYFGGGFYRPYRRYYPGGRCR